MLRPQPRDCKCIDPESWWSLFLPCKTLSFSTSLAQKCPIIVQPQPAGVGRDISRRWWVYGGHGKMNLKPSKLHKFWADALGLALPGFVPIWVPAGCVNESVSRPVRFFCPNSILRKAMRETTRLGHARQYSHMDVWMRPERLPPQRSEREKSNRSKRPGTN